MYDKQQVDFDQRDIPHLFHTDTCTHKYMLLLTVLVYDNTKVEFLVAHYVEVFFALPLLDGVLLRLLREEFPDFVLFLSSLFSAAAALLSVATFFFALLFFPPLDVDTPSKRPMTAKTGTTKNNGSDGTASGLPIAS